MKKKYFEYVVLHHKETKDGEGSVEHDTTIIIDKTSKLAKDEKSLGMLIARELPESVLDDLENVEIIIRNF